jgi:hypothetical protein
MHRVLGVSLFAATILSPLQAQNPPSSAPPPTVMQQAIDGLIKIIAAGQFQVPAPAAAVAPNAICSVPLIEMHAADPERYTMNAVPPPAIESRMPVTPGPAPACQPTASSSPAEPRP